MLIVLILIITSVSVFSIFYKDYRTIEKLTEEIGRLTFDNELLQIDLEGQKIFSKVYGDFLKSCQFREMKLIEELESLQKKDVKSKKAVKKEIKKNKKTKE